MFYIEKNDKPNWLEKKLKLIKINENIIYLPDLENTEEQKIKKIALRTSKIINKQSNSKKIIISKDLKQQEKYLEYLYESDLEIQDGKWLFEILLPDIVKYLTLTKNIKKANISILINNLNDLEVENIKFLSRKYKTINIVTNYIEKYKNIQNQLEEEGIIITITNNKKRSLLKSNIIINIDFSNELINQYKIFEEANIINIKEKVKIKQKRFNGICINNYEIDFRDDLKDEKAIYNKYYLKDIYESEIYKKQRLEDIKQKIKLDKVKIKKLILNNGEL